jgi:TPR repeat protein
VTQDQGEALKWYQKSADQALAAAQYNLGLMHALGQGVQKDFVQAHMWWTLASRQGHQGASKNREIAAGAMSLDQMLESRTLARAWRPK